MAYMSARLYTDDFLPHTPGSWQAFAGCFAGDPCALFESRRESPSSVTPAPSTCIWCIRGVLGKGASCELSQKAHTGQHLTDQHWPSWGMLSGCSRTEQCCCVLCVQMWWNITALNATSSAAFTTSFIGTSPNYTFIIPYANSTAMPGPWSMNVSHSSLCVTFCARVAHILVFNL